MSKLKEWHKQLLKGQKDGMVADTANNFFGLHNVTSLPEMDAPQKLQLFLYGICTSGSVDMEIDLRSHRINAGEILRLKMGQTVKVNGTSEGFKGTFFLFDRKFLSDTIAGIKIPLSNMSPVIATSDELKEQMVVYLDIMFKKYKQLKKNDDPYLRKAVEMVSKALLCEILCEVTKKSEKRQTSRAQDIFYKFAEIVGKYYLENRSVDFYAKQLCISHKYLCKVVSECIGITPSQYIDQQVMEEAKHLLKDTEMSVSEIAQRMNFVSQSFFGRYFKSHAGCSPGAFRYE